MTIITAEVLVTEFFKVTKERIVSFYRLKEIAKEYEKNNKGVEVDYIGANLRKVALGNPNTFILKGDYIITKRKQFGDQTLDCSPIGVSIAEINNLLVL